MATKIQLRRDSSTNWGLVNPILAEGEMGVELDTKKIKIGDGINSWNFLNYYNNDVFIISGSTNNSNLILTNNNETDIIIDLNNFINYFKTSLKFNKTITSSSFNYVINQIEHNIENVSSVTVYNTNNEEVEVFINNNNNNITILSNIDLIDHKIIIY